MTILNKHSAEINLNSDFWSAYHPKYIELSEENNCFYFMPYKELTKIPNTGVGFLSIFDNNFDHVYHNSSRANDDIYVGDPSLNVNYEIIDLTSLRQVDDTLNYFAALYLVENDAFNITTFNISVYSMDYVSNTVDKLVLIQDSMILSTINSDVKNFVFFRMGMFCLYHGLSVSMMR